MNNPKIENQINNYLKLISVVFWLSALALLIWEFWPFKNKLAQLLAFSSTVTTETAVMKKINVVEFEIDINQQRVIQKIISPLRTSRGRAPICTFFGQGCDDNNYSPSDEEKGFTEIRQSLPVENNRLLELENCTVKSSADWICRSSWYHSMNIENEAYFVGKSDGKWISNPSLLGLINWKVILLFERLKCGGNVCFITTKAKRLQVQKEREDEMDRFIFSVQKKRSNQ